MGAEHLGKKKASNMKVLLAFVGFLVISLALFFLTIGSQCPAFPSQDHGSTRLPINPQEFPTLPINPLGFMHRKKVLLVSHELTLTGGPLLLMELAILLRNAGAVVEWITINQRDGNAVTKNLEAKLQNNGVQIVPAKGAQTVNTAMEADLIVLNTAVAGKWIDSTFKSHEYQKVLPKVLWWIHEMRGHYFTLDYVKHLPYAAAAMIDSHATADYWKNRTRQRLGIEMPKTYVVHLGNSKGLTEAAQNSLARDLLRQHVRESLGVPDQDIILSAINSVSRGKGQDLFLKAFNEALKLVNPEESNKLHALIVGSDFVGQPKFETELRDFVKKNNIEHSVHFVNKTMNVVPYLAATDVLVQNSQARGECFGRISIEAMAFKLPILGTAAGGTKEIVVDGSTGFLHIVGKEGVPVLAKNMVKLFNDPKLRTLMGEAGYRRVQEQFMEHHMAQRIAHVLRQIVH